MYLYINVNPLHHRYEYSRRLFSSTVVYHALSTMCLTTTFFIALFGMVAAIKYKIIKLCPTKAPRFPSEEQLADIEPPDEKLSRKEDWDVYCLLR